MGVYLKIPGLNIDIGKKSKLKSKVITPLKSLIYSIFIFISLYLSFKVNNGFNFGSFIVALLFPFIYIPYALAVYGIDIIWTDSIQHKKERK